MSEPEVSTARVTRPRRAPAARPDQILDAATDILLADGLRGLTMDGIASAAGLAKGTAYLYFASKAQVLAALRVRQVRRMLDACHEAAAADPSASTMRRVERFLETVFDVTLANARLLRLLFHEAGGDDSAETGMTVASLLVLVREGIANGEFRVADPETVVGFLVHGMHGAFADGLAGPPEAHERLVDSVKDVFRRQLLAAHTG
jgi:AcrR family transcriptional regulator